MVINLLDPAGPFLRQRGDFARQPPLHDRRGGRYVETSRRCMHSEV
ncbi:hypothetical protein [Mycobacterium attenuatum]|nr:hypothetical protein [Mycobacterium attenuatum]